MSSMNETHFTKCRYVSVNGFFYNVKQQLQAISGTLINSSNHLSDIGTINLKEITKLMFPKLPFAHTTAVAENVQFYPHNSFDFFTDISEDRYLEFCWKFALL